MPNASWKQVERAICRYLGCERQGADGSSNPDCNCPDGRIAVQIKHRKDLPEWLLGMVLQTMGQANSEQLPLLVLHPEKWPYEDSMVIITLKDAKKLLIEAGRIGAIIEVPLKEVE